MGDNEKKQLLQHLPAILTGTAALIAALTGVYVNLRDDRAAPPPHSAVPERIQPARTPQAPPSPVVLRLHVDRIVVGHDGSRGTTDWRFTVEADGEPLFAFTQEALDESGGRNVAVPKAGTGLLRLASGRHVHLTIQGWRGGLLGFGAKALAHGEGDLAGAGALAPIRVQAADPGDGAFVFHLAAEPAGSE